MDATRIGGAGSADRGEQALFETYSLAGVSARLVRLVSVMALGWALFASTPAHSAAAQPEAVTPPPPALARRADAWLSFRASRSTYLACLHTVPRALDACGISVAPRGGSAACSCVA